MELDSVAVLVVSGQKPCLTIGKAVAELNVSVCVALLHPLLGTECDSVITHAPVPMLMVVAPPTSTDVVLVAVAVQSPTAVTCVGVSPVSFQQLLNVGPMPTPAAFVVVAEAPVAFRFKVTVHDTTPEPEVSVRLPWPCTTVPCGSQLVADAEEARSNVTARAGPITL